MIILNAEKRELTGKKIDSLREKGLLPGVLYGPEIDNLNIQLNLKEFEKAYKQAGESTLISLKIKDKDFSVLIYEVKKDPLKSHPIHVDFYQPILTEEVEASVPIVFEGESLAIKELGGTLVREIQEIDVKALPKDLPHEIKADIDGLKTFEDEILVKDLPVPEGVTFLREPDDIVAVVTPPEKIEEELEKPIEEKEVEVEGEKKEESQEEQMEEKDE